MCDLSSAPRYRNEKGHSGLAVPVRPYHNDHVTTSSRDFLNLAGREASRYGGESIVFLRELLQNARDAGAGSVVIETEVENGVELIRVADDGRGMGLDHAQRFLLTLYASSKRGSVGAAGRFGVGFWSILRFEPSEIMIRSRAVDSEAGWEIVFDSGLTVLAHRPCQMAVGTAVELKRPARMADLGISAWDLVRRDARHLRVKDDPETLMAITVNGRQATERIVPGEPGLFFRRRGLRGAISLGSVSEVTLLAHGLRVRSASSVDDLLLRPGRRHSRPQRQPTSGLSPRVVVDSDRLAVLMDRGDVAQDRALVAVAKVIRSEIRRLCEMELDRLAPRSVWRKAWDRFTERRVGIGLSLMLLIGAALGMWGAAFAIENWIRPGPAGRSAREHRASEPYVDRSSSYGGPVTESIDGVGNAPRLVYRPPDQRPLLAAFRVAGINEDGTPIKDVASLRAADGWVGAPDSCLEFELDFVANGKLLRLPVPTGESVDGNSVTLNGHAVSLFLTGNDEPVLRLDGETEGLVEYRTAERPVEGTAGGRWPVLPPAVARAAADLKSLQPSGRVEEAIMLVRTSLESSVQSPAAGFFGSVYRAGGGDCDVVNTVLAAVLDQAGLQSRMAVGWIGAGGGPIPGLHAWVEVDLGGGRWVAADATVPTPEGAAIPDPGGRNEIGLKDSDHEMSDWPLGWVGLVAGVVLVLGCAVARWRHRGRREFSVSDDLDTGPLVESLVRDREAWPGFGEARRRKLVPALGQDRRSLAEIEMSASRMALFVAESSGEWVERVDGVVLDGTSRAGRIAAAAFGAFDLDRWEGLWRRSRSEPFCVEVQDALHRAGLATEIRHADDVPDGAGMAFAMDGGPKAWVVIDESNPEWKRGRDQRERNRAEALFRAADVIVGMLPGAGSPQKKALAMLARDALLAMRGRSA